VGHAADQNCWALVNSGLADAAAQSARSPMDLARDLDFDSDVTTRLVEAAVALRLMRYGNDGRVHLTKIGARLCTEHPYSVSAWVAFLADPACALAYGHLETQLRQGA
jgi:hypothetical protein